MEREGVLQMEDGAGWLVGYFNTVVSILSKRREMRTNSQAGSALPPLPPVARQSLGGTRPAEAHYTFSGSGKRKMEVMEVMK